MTSRRLRCVVATFLALGLGVVSHDAPAQTPSKCRAADERSTALIVELKQWVLYTDPRRIYERDNYYHIPVVPLTQITLVTDEQICAKIVAEYSKLPQNPYTPASVYVIKNGKQELRII